MIQYQNVVKHYQKGEDNITAVDNLSLEIKEGELVIFLGPSGCGKTTLLRLTNRLEDLSAGQIKINGKNINHQDPVKLRQGLGYVIQEIGLFPNKTIGENIGMVPKVKGWSQTEIDNRVDELLKMMNLDPKTYKNRYPAQLSGGQKQRVGVVRALAADPKIMLMDEPFGAIDPINRKKIQDEFLKLQKKLQKTIIFVSHDLQEAIKMADKIALIKDGQVVQYDTPENILLKPANEFVKDFVGSERAMNALNLVAVDEIVQPANYKYDDLTVREALQWFNKYSKDHLLICNQKEEPLGYLSAEKLKQYAMDTKEIDFSNLIDELYTYLNPKDTLKEALSAMVSNEVTTLCVVDGKGKLLGTINFSDIQQYLVDNYYQDQEIEA